MTKNELSRAVKLVQDKQHKPLDTNKFDGFALRDFKPVTCTIDEIASLVAWQCLNLNGTIDGNALQEIADAGRYKFSIVGNGAENA